MNDRLLTGMHRLQRIKKQANGRVRLVIHGTNGFSDELTQQCVAAGISKINVNKLVLGDYNAHLKIKRVSFRKRDSSKKAYGRLSACKSIR